MIAISQRALCAMLACNGLLEQAPCSSKVLQRRPFSLNAREIEATQFVGSAPVRSPVRGSVGGVDQHRDISGCKHRGGQAERKARIEGKESGRRRQTYLVKVLPTERRIGRRIAQDRRIGARANKMSSDEEEMDGGTLAPAPADEEEEEDIDGGTLKAVDQDDEEEDIDGGSLDAVDDDLFGPSNKDYQSSTVQSLWLPPGRQNGRIVCVKRGAAASASHLAPPPPSKRPAAAVVPKKAAPRFVAASASDADLVASAAVAKPASAVKREDPVQAPAADGGGGGGSAAARMMAKMGFQAGGGLGKEAQGRKEALVESGNVGMLGLGFQGAKSVSDESLPPLPKVAAPLSKAELDPCPLPSWMAACATPPPDTATLKSWLVEGKRIESVDDETEHIEPRILKSILRAKTQFDHITDRRAFNDARTRANPFEAIKKEFFLNRAALKMAAMDAAFELIFSGADAPDLG